MLSINLLPKYLLPCPRKPRGFWQGLPHASQRELAQYRRRQMQAKLGGRCANPDCQVPGGCADPRALQVDHVNNDGSLDGTRNDPNAMYAKVMADRGGRFQLLCANCNVIKEYDRQDAATQARHAALRSN